MCYVSNGTEFTRRSKGFGISNLCINYTLLCKIASECEQHLGKVNKGNNVVTLTLDIKVKMQSGLLP